MGYSITLMKARAFWSSSVYAALGAAALFGASTPFAKVLLKGTSPVLLAGLLYLGSGIGLGLVRLLRDRGWRIPSLSRPEWGWLVLAIGLGGVLGPLLLMFGLATTPASTASLLLNLEAVLTAVIAWVVFRESTDRNVMLGMLVIVTGAALLTWPDMRQSTGGWSWGSLFIACACLCWALDNNFTRKVSASDALFLAGLKGMVAGVVNTGMALVLGARLPGAVAMGGAMIVGLLGYGVSLVLFVLALRGLGTARTGAYFSTAPFIGAAIAILIFGEQVTGVFWVVFVLMAVGVWLHLTERHEHMHTHEAIIHTHRHVHDEHHHHSHDFPWDGREPHTHEHTHAPITHNHPHYPDIHHRHRHSDHGN